MAADRRRGRRVHRRRRSDLGGHGAACADPGHRAGRRRLLPRVVGDQRIPARLHRGAADRGAHRRRARSRARLRGRPWACSCWAGALVAAAPDFWFPGRREGLAGRRGRRGRPGGDGDRRRADAARAPRARPRRDRRGVRGGRPRRPALGRPHHGTARLAVDVLAQHPDVAAGARRRVVARAQRARRGAHRLAGSGDARGRAGRAHHRHRRRPDRASARGRSPRCCSRSRRRSRSRSRCASAGSRSPWCGSRCSRRGRCRARR